MDNLLRLIQLDALQVAVWLNTTRDPPAAQWSEACAKVAASVRTGRDDVSKYRVFVVSDGGSPNSAQRRELFEEALLGHAVPTAVVTRAMATNPVRRGIAHALALLKPHYRVFEPKETLLAIDHIGVERARFEVIWRTLRFLQGSLPTVVTLRLIGEELHLPFEPLRPSQIPPSYRPPVK
jgi:hypothetical protein